MKRSIIFILLAGFFLQSCTKVPISKRRQLKLLPAGQMLQMSLAQYSMFLNESDVDNNSADAKMVKEVGADLAEAVNTYFTKTKQIKRLKNFKWEFNLVEDSLVNAWCMPGGKVVVYSGILPITKTRDGLAVVMGHEVSHAVARHGNERMSQGLLQQVGGLGLAVAARNKPAQTQQVFMQAYGAASTLGILKYSRTHETEADQLGLIFMALAGYNPREAAPFWTRMSEAGNGQEPPEFISTHPNHDTRIKDIETFLPTALRYYKQSK